MSRCTRVRGRKTLTNAADEHRDISSLPATVRVELVENEELQSIAVGDHFSVELVLTGHQELKHHEVRQQDVGWIVPDPLVFRLSWPV